MHAHMNNSSRPPLCSQLLQTATRRLKVPFTATVIATAHYVAARVIVVVVF